MSMRTWTIDGYGVNVSNLKIDDYMMAAFLRKYFSNDFEIFDIKSDATDAEIVEIFDYSYESGNGDLSVWAAVSDLILKKENVFVEYIKGECEEAIILPSCMPWQYNEKERALTIEDLEEIFSKYFKELGYPEVDVDSQSIEFYG